MSPVISALIYPLIIIIPKMIFAYFIIFRKENVYMYLDDELSQDVYILVAISLSMMRLHSYSVSFCHFTEGLPMGRDSWLSGHNTEKSLSSLSSSIQSILKALGSWHLLCEKANMKIYSPTKYLVVHVQTEVWNVYKFKCI